MELEMKLEAYPTVDTSSGMAQVQSKLQALTLQFQEIKKGKEKREGVQCTNFHTKDHHEGECPMVTKYLVAGEQNILVP